MNTKNGTKTSSPSAKRWQLIHRTSGKQHRSGFSTRQDARDAKGPNHRIFDSENATFVR